MAVLDTEILVNYYFEEICKIPHGSYNEEKIADFVEAFAKEKGFRYHRDHLNNIVIYKEASQGYENHETLMLEAHMDMVNEKNKDSNHDFEHDPLDLYLEDGYVSANGTTLGADDGYGVAYMLAILSDPNVKNPPLECVFTVAEEVGLDGALGFDASLLKATRMIGLDSENEGEICTTSSGGCDVMITKELYFTSNENPTYTLLIKGLSGGHSGGEIHRGKGNANKLAARVMYGMIKANLDIQLVDLNGGLKNNAIPRECAIVFASTSDFKLLQEVADEYQDYFSEEFEISDPGVKVELSLNNDIAQQTLSIKESKDIIKLMMAAKSGFVERSLVIEDLTTVSLNMGVVSIKDKQLKIDYLLRSPMKSAVMNMVDELDIIADAFGGTITPANYYPGWNYDQHSKLRDLFKAFYFKRTGAEVKEVATHGGLETGIFKWKMPALDIITMGPNMADIHTPDERMEVASFVNCYEILKDFIATL